MNTDACGIRGREAEGHAGNGEAIGQRARLQPRSVRLRIAAAACAGVATVLTVGSQLGMGALYSGELDTTLAALKTQPRAMQVAASGPALQQPGMGPHATGRQVVARVTR
jgi:hypothetical protein